MEALGTTPTSQWVYSGECGAIEVEDARMMDEDLRDMDKEDALEEVTESHYSPA
jgi:hypothetical protein